MFRLFAYACLLAALVLSCEALAEGWTPPPKGQDAYDTMRHLYRELLRFKSDPVFLRDHWKAGTAYASFKIMVDGLDKDQKAIMHLMKSCNERDVSAAFCMPSDLGRLGSAYYLSKGAETADTRKLRGQFDKMLSLNSDAAQPPAAGRDGANVSIESLRAEIEQLEADKREHGRLDNRGDVKRLTKLIREKKAQLLKLTAEEKKAKAAAGEGR
jgi:hypothetical protein